MTTQVNTNDPRAKTVSVAGDELNLDLVDGRSVVVPLEWFSALSNASADQLDKYEIVESGRAIRWVELEEEISVSGLLRGIAALGED